MESFGRGSAVVTAEGLVAEVDEAIAADAEENTETPLDRVLGLVESRLINGRSDTSVCRWITNLGIPESVANEMIREIRIGWRTVGQDYETYCARRDLARARLNKIFEMAMEKGDLRNATAAVKHLVDLDGLEAPKTLNISASIQTQQITNASRETVAQLMERMRTLAEARKVSRLSSRGVAADGAPRALEIIDVREAKASVPDHGEADE